MPSAGFAENRPALAAFEQAVFFIGGGALARWLLGGRVLPGALLWGLSAWTALCLLSLGTTTDLYATRDAVFFLTSMVVLALAILISLTDGTKARIFLGGLVLIALGEAVIGLGQYVRGESTPAYWLSRAFAGMIQTRIHGTLGNPNVLADFLLVGIGAAVLLAVDLPGRWRVLPAVALAVEVIALPLTYSRGGYAGLIVLIISAGGLLWPVRRRAWPVLFVILVVTGLVAVWLPTVGLRAESVRLDQGDTATSRLFIWRAGLRMWESHQAWGTGLGTFNAAYASYRPLGVLTTYASLRIPGSAHNDYLQLLAETGVFGIVLLALALLWGLWRAGRRYLRGSTGDQIWLGTWGAVLAGIGVASLVNSNLSVITNALVLIAFTAAVAARESVQHLPIRFWQRLLALPLAAVLVGMPPLLFPPARAFAFHEEAFRDVKAGRYAEAVDAFRAAVAADPLNGMVPAYFGDLLADLYLRRIDSSMGPWWTARERAAEMYGLAERLDPWNGYPRAALGRLRRAEGRYDEAEAALRRAIALDPYAARYRLWLGGVLVATQHPAGASEQLHEALRLYPLELLVIEHHEGRNARYREVQADLDEARRLLRTVDRTAP
jgi:O-antigen ligase